MSFFLKIKAWQLFVLIVAPMVAPFFFFPSPNYVNLFRLITAFWMFVLVGWMFSVGYSANLRLPESLQKSTLIYKLGYVVALSYVVVLSAANIFQDPVSNQAGPNPIPAWLVPLHLASMFGMFYGLWFTAKQFTTLLQDKEVKFFEYSGPFFLFWFSPIGVWVLQPRVNEVFSKSEA